MSKWITLFFVCATLFADDDYQFRGKHFIASYSGCNFEAITDVEGLKRAMEDAVRLCGATTLSQSFHEFNGHGLTMVILLSESHASIHTYPEHRACFVDLFTCGDLCSNEKFDEVLRHYLKPMAVHEKILLRHERTDDY